MNTLDTQRIRTLALSALLGLAAAPHAAAQEVVAVGLPRDNWYVQLGLDVTLQDPYGTPEGSTFREGRTGGIDVSVGRWFTPAIGMRLRGNWENGFAPLSNRKATWLNFMTPGEPNAEHGGYVAVAGDVQLDLMGLFAPYRNDRRWRCQVYPRAGLVYNCGLHKGSPLVGAGVGSTYRLNRRFTLCFDVTYQMVSSGFNARWTDVGTGCNAYLDATLGLQFNLGRNGFGTYNYRRTGHEHQ